jgi:hypothetical protein
VVQARPSAQAELGGSGAKLQLPPPLQLSDVQGLLSSQPPKLWQLPRWQAAALAHKPPLQVLPSPSATAPQLPLAMSQTLAVQGSLSVQVLGTPRHWPSWHKSALLHRLPSLQGMVMGLPLHWPLLQVSNAVQTLASSHGILLAGLPLHWPDLQVSLKVQGEPSSQLAPLAGV